MVIRIIPVGVVGSDQCFQKFPRHFLPFFGAIWYLLVFLYTIWYIFATVWYCSGVVGNVVCEKSFQELFSLTYNTDRAAAREK